jgi:dolichol-phosphate mannosyltransferase
MHLNCIKKKPIAGLKPFLSPHINLTLELPLKAIVRGLHIQ